MIAKMILVLSRKNYREIDDFDPKRIVFRMEGIKRGGGVLIFSHQKPILSGLREFHNFLI